MKIIKVRSPFFVTVNEIGQIGSKIELFIWNKGTTEPATPTYTLSKAIPSATQIDNNYNISNYIREYISPIKPTLVTTPTVEDNNAWAICKVKRYKLVGTTYTLLDTIEYVCIDGFTNYSDGRQLSIDTDVAAPALILNNANIISNYYTNPYLNILCQKNSGFNLSAKYYTKANVLIDTQTILALGSGTEYFNYKIPFRSTLSTDDYQKLSLNYENVFYNKVTIKNEECKYIPVTCSFINRLGGWEFLTFFKQQTNSISVKGTNYKLMPNNINYDVSVGQNKTFNLNGTQTVKLNTGFVDENYSELITDLLLSEIILLDNKPVTLKTQGSDLKTVLKDRMINKHHFQKYRYQLKLFD